MTANTKYSKFPSRRSVVYSTKGIASSSQTLASSAGVKILEKGGNAVDAAVATAAVLAVVEPHQTGVGGDMFALFYSAKDKTVKGINGSGRSPAALSLDKVLKQDPELQKRESLPSTSVHTCTVPGTVAGWVDSVDKWGSGNVSLKDILQPAIEIADKGFALGDITANAWNAHKGVLLKASPANYAELLRKDGTAPASGNIFRNANIAQTLRLIADKGKSGFYSGETAAKIIDALQSRGSFMTQQDLINHQSTFVDSASIDYAGLRVHEIPPNGQGLVALLALGVIRELQNKGKIPSDLAAHWGHNSTEYLHLLIEVIKMGFRDAVEHVCDPDHNPPPLKQLLSTEYLSNRADEFTATAAKTYYEPGTLEPLAVPSSKSKSDTVYLTCSDSQGNACSFINSIYSGFASGIIPKGTGFVLQNRGANFSLRKESRNSLAGNKRPYHTIIPAMVTNIKSNDLYASYGVMGGFMQPQGHVQVLLNLRLWGFNPQQALDAPRLCITQQAEGNGHWSTEVCLEEGISEDIAESLRKLGHSVTIISGFDRSLFGRGQVIQRNQDPDTGEVFFAAGSDPRGDGAAIPQV